MNAAQRSDATTTPWPWPDELDALQAAPRHHQLLMENERVRVLATRIPAGETTAVHTHRWPAVNHINSWSDFVRRDSDGRVLVDTRGRPHCLSPFGRSRCRRMLWRMSAPRNFTS